MPIKGFTDDLNTKKIFLPLVNLVPQKQLISFHCQLPDNIKGFDQTILIVLRAVFCLTMYCKYKVAFAVIGVALPC